jgi:peptide/nickel transport system substrate-binding protein
VRKKLSFQLFSLLVVLGLILSACGSKSTGGQSVSKDDKQDVSKMPTDVKNEGKIDPNGILKYGLVSGTAFKGTLNPVFYEDNYDYEVFQWFQEQLLRTNGDYEIDNDGAATYTLSSDKKTITIKIRDNVNWTDGKPVLAEDLQYAYEVLGSPQYTGARYDSLMATIVGMDAYHKGKAKTISGIKILNKKTLSITYTQASPSILTGIWTYPLPKHIFKNIPISKMPSSDAVRKNPIGFGPFKVTKIVPGESVEFAANDDYWKGKPKLKGVILKVVNPNTVLASLRKGDVDLVDDFPANLYLDAKKSTNFQMLGKLDLAYNYLGFKLGKWDAKKGVSVTDPNAKMANVKLRQSMGYALNMDEVGTKIYHGLRYRANTVIPPSFPGYHDTSAKGFPYDPSKAKKLLDEAGYKDVDKDGYREDPQGHKLVIHMMAMSGDDTAEPIAKYYIQSWKNIGLNVDLVDGRLHELNSFYDMIGKDDPKIDIFAAAWGTGSDVDPSWAYGGNSMFNYTRWHDKTSDDLMAQAITSKGFDTQWRKQTYDKWQEYINEQAPAIPLLYRSLLGAANNRVKNYSMSPSTKLDYSDLAVTSETPDVSK